MVTSVLRRRVYGRPPTWTAPQPWRDVPFHRVAFQKKYNVFFFTIVTASEEPKSLISSNLINVTFSFKTKGRATCMNAHQEKNSSRNLFRTVWFTSMMAISWSLVSSLNPSNIMTLETMNENIGKYANVLHLALYFKWKQYLEHFALQGRVK